MLDVHPPHESIQSWKAFFVHIATIVIGLLIAVALEQTVEFFHHRHQVAETREALHEEMQKNIAMFHENVERHIMTMAYLHNNLRIFEYLRDHPGTSQDRLPGILYWPLFTTAPQKAAWATAEHTDVLSYMPRAEVRETTDRYAKLDYSWETYQPVIASLTQCTSYFSQTPDISTLPPASVLGEIEAIKLAITREALYGGRCCLIGACATTTHGPGSTRNSAYRRNRISMQRAPLQGCRRTRVTVRFTSTPHPNPTAASP